MRPADTPARPLAGADPAATPAPFDAAGLSSSLYRRIGVLAVLVLTIPALLVFIVAAGPQPGVPTATAMAGDAALTPARLGAGAYAAACAVCHGPDGEGVRNLGKPLRNSAFVQAQSDEELFRLIVDGRPVADPLNTTGALMPPRGAQGMSDERIGNVVAYLRSIQEPGVATVSMEPWDLRSQGGAVAAAAVELKGHQGFDVFVASCAACHGQGAEGMEDLGLPLSTSGFVRGKSDSELIAFIKSGRPSWDESNTTGLDMPPKGGNPAVTDEQLQSIVDYLRAVQKQAMGS